MEATDGEIGKCEDLLFYDHSGHLAYFVVETGKWFSHNKVLIAPVAIDTEKARARAPGGMESIPSNLSKEKVESSPPYETDRPVSDEYSARLAFHYEWPYRVGDGSLWGTGVFAGDAPLGLDKTAPAPKEVENEGDRTLRSAKEILGYTVVSKDDMKAGAVSDVVVDPMLSALPYLRVRDKALFKPRDFILPWECVAGFSLASEEIQTTIDGAILKNAPEAPEKEAFSDSSVESSIRSYYRF